MWWPAVGGLVIGVGGWISPHALGVGYDVIANLLSGDIVARAALAVLIVKATIWAVAVWPLVGMAAILGGAMRVPLTAIVFALELSHDVNMLLPLMIAVVAAEGFTVLALRRSILTEKVDRRGFHLSREYATDPLELVFVSEVMSPEPEEFPMTLRDGE